MLKWVIMLKVEKIFICIFNMWTMLVLVKYYFILFKYTYKKFQNILAMYFLFYMY